MKTKILGLVVLFLMGAFTVFAGNKTEKIEVKGNCGMCKTRIEKAALSVKGVTAAEWNKKTKVLAFSYKDSKTNVDEVEKAVAKVGHDTPHYKADDEVYKNLPGCCHYDRTAEATTKDAHEGHKH